VTRTADLLADAGMQDAIEFGPGRHGATNAFFLYVRDPAGNRLEFYWGDYLRDHDRPPVRWEIDDYRRRGLLWWGQDPPETFFEAGPIRDSGRFDPAGVGSDAG